MNKFKIILAIFIFFLLPLGLASVFTVTEGQEAILLRLGKLVADRKTSQTLVLKPGLHFKMPLFESIRFFDMRIQTLDIKSSRIVTKEKKDVIVDYYVKWRIQNPAQYFKSTGGIQYKAETLLEQQLNTSLRAQFGKRTISDLISGGRDDVMGLLRDNAETQANGLGVHVVDVRIKGVELPPTTSNAVYQRMRADMQKIANRHRADGQAEAEAIQAKADAGVTVIIAEAKSKGEAIRAEGQAKAATIYADAYTKNPDFFAFLQSLKAYQGSFSDKQDWFVLDGSSTFFEYFKHPFKKS